MASLKNRLIRPRRKAGIVQLLIQQRRAELINQLRTNSTIVQPSASGI